MPLALTSPIETDRPAVFSKDAAIRAAFAEIDGIKRPAGMGSPPSASPCDADEGMSVADMRREFGTWRTPL